MSNIVLLTTRNKPLLIFAGLVFTLNGYFTISNHDPGPVSIILGGLLIIFGVFYLTLGLFGLFGVTRFASRISVNEESIEIKTNLWKQLTVLKWEEVVSIHFGSYQLKFELKNGTKEFTYQSRADESIHIKGLIRDAAAKRNIEISGG